jgi:isoleucyl-tRNA synthetase
VEADDPDKLAAYRVLYDVLGTTVRLMAPFTPYMAERMYQNLVRNAAPESPVSVHMCDWPKVDGSLLDERLNKDMDIARKIVEASSNARQKAKRKLRWPVSKIVVAAETGDVVTAVKDLTGVIKEQTNAREIVLLAPGEAYAELGVEVMPNPKAIGPVFKGNAGKVIAELKAADGRAMRKALATDGKYTLELSVGPVEVTPEIVGFRDVIPEHLAIADFPGGKVYVDVELTPELEAEGYTRELIRRIQETRKEMNLNVEDRITVQAWLGDAKVHDLIATMKDYLAGEVRASALELKDKKEEVSGYLKDWDVEGTPVTIGIEKV